MKDIAIIIASTLAYQAFAILTNGDVKEYTIVSDDDYTMDLKYWTVHQGEKEFLDENWPKVPKTIVFKTTLTSERNGFN